ncbi:hypothetical protein DV702_04765 [Sporosarcina sp. PTS2304]|uniref:hypothetical protein n=1 Tax=Sporosarcina sp. PTS2304 TaxID=2283194 RepID=UPI000E0D69C2|nr:hypothetical protein [Sporosarcina sp. PTS2304]AXH99106.1 hypothetical protein DV702_04765 [Sporosarcina sp. PTS2304]
MRIVTVNDLFNYAVETDMSLTAHSIFWAITERKVHMEDDSQTLQHVSFDRQAVDQLMKENKLCIGRIQLFVMQCETPGLYAFYVAEAASHVFQLHHTYFRERGVNVTQADRLLCRLMRCARTGKEESLYTFKKEVASFPAYLGHARAGERVLYGR